jgi:hypothetical protein
MKRKKWTAKTEVSEALTLFREKRKWQIALRRYAFDQNRSSFYAPYFGLDIKHFRKWIEIQFEAGMEWDNFSGTWQFDHIVPLVYFNFKDERDLRLCWNFTNIRVERAILGQNQPNQVDIISAKRHFGHLYELTKYLPCQDMVRKIEGIEDSQLSANTLLGSFILENKHLIDVFSTLTSAEFISLNKGNALSEVLAERKLLEKFGK